MPGGNYPCFIVQSLGSSHSRSLLTPTQAQQPRTPGAAFFSHLQMVTKLQLCCVTVTSVTCCHAVIDYEINVSPLGNVCTPCSYCCFLITAVCCCCCCGVAGAGAGVVFVRVNNWWKVSPPRVSRVMGTFIAAFINLHITITTEGRLLFHVMRKKK